MFRSLCEDTCWQQLRLQKRTDSVSKLLDSNLCRLAMHRSVGSSRAKENAERVISLKCKASLQLSSVTQEHSQKSAAKPQATDDAENSMFIAASQTTLRGCNEYADNMHMSPLCPNLVTSKPSSHKHGRETAVLFQTP